MDRGAWRATVYGATESDMTVQLPLRFTFAKDFFKIHACHFIYLQYVFHC